MTITELQARLEVLKEKHGDIVVTMHQWDDPDMPCDVDGAVPLEVKKHYDGYVREGCLLNGGWAGGPKFTEPYLTKVQARPTQTVAFLSEGIG